MKKNVMKRVVIGFLTGLIAMIGSSSISASISRESTSLSAAKYREINPEYKELKTLVLVIFNRQGSMNHGGASEISSHLSRRMRDGMNKAIQTLLEDLKTKNKIGEMSYKVMLAGWETREWNLLAEISEAGENLSELESAAGEFDDNLLDLLRNSNREYYERYKYRDYEQSYLLENRCTNRSDVKEYRQCLIKTLLKLSVQTHPDTAICQPSSIKSMEACLNMMHEEQRNRQDKFNTYYTKTFGEVYLDSSVGLYQTLETIGTSFDEVIIYNTTDGQFDTANYRDLVSNGSNGYSKPLKPYMDIYKKIDPLLKEKEISKAPDGDGPVVKLIRYEIAIPEGIRPRLEWDGSEFKAEEKIPYGKPMEWSLWKENAPVFNFKDINEKIDIKSYKIEYSMKGGEESKKGSVKWQKISTSELEYIKTYGRFNELEKRYAKWRDAAVKNSGNVKLQENQIVYKLSLQGFYDKNIALGSEEKLIKIPFHLSYEVPINVQFSKLPGTKITLYEADKPASFYLGQQANERSITNDVLAGTKRGLLKFERKTSVKRIEATLIIGGQNYSRDLDITSVSELGDEFDFKFEPWITEIDNFQKTAKNASIIKAEYTLNIYGDDNAPIAEFILPYEIKYAGLLRIFIEKYLWYVFGVIFLAILAWFAVFGKKMWTDYTKTQNDNANAASEKIKEEVRQAMANCIQTAPSLINVYNFETKEYVDVDLGSVDFLNDTFYVGNWKAEENSFKVKFLKINDSDISKKYGFEYNNKLDFNGRIDAVNELKYDVFETIEQDTVVLKAVLGKEFRERIKQRYADLEFTLIRTISCEQFEGLSISDNFRVKLNVVEKV